MSPLTRQACLGLGAEDQPLGDQARLEGLLWGRDCPGRGSARGEGGRDWDASRPLWRGRGGGRLNRCGVIMEGRGWG